MDFYKLDSILSRIERKIHLLYLLKPLNLHFERSKFLKDPVHPPQFRYRPLPFNPEELLSRLSELETDKTPLGMIFREKIEELKLKIILLQARGTSRFPKLSEKLYGTVTESLYEEAVKKLRPPSSKKRISGEHIFTSEETKKIFERIFDEYCLNHWYVKLKDQMATDCVAGKRNVLFIRKKALFSRKRIARLVAHEIETHIFTAENGKLQPYRIFNTGFARYLETQEGLALYAQEVKQDTPSAIQSWAALSAIAVAKALDMGFTETFHHLIGLGVGEKRAWRTVMRVKRGLSDTGMKGAFAKELVYYAGAMKIHEYVKKGNDLKKLYIGKIALQDLPFIKKIPNLLPPKYIPRWITEPRGNYLS